MDLYNRIETAIKSFLKDGTPFTLLDISNSVKQDGEGFVRHRDCRDIAIQVLHDLKDDVDLLDYTYSSILVTTPRGQEYANLYHPEDYDVDDYTNTNQKALKPSQITTQKVSAPVQSVNSSNTSSISAISQIIAQKMFAPVQSVNPTNPSPIFKTTSQLQTNAHEYKLKKLRLDGAIEIPKALLVESGLLGDFVDIINHPNSISIVKGDSKLARPGMRIYKSTLAMSNLEDDDLIEAAAFANKIVLA